MLGWNNLQNLKANGSLITDDLIVTCGFETVISMDYMVYFNFFGWVLPPLLLMLAIYVEIFYIIHKQLNKKVTDNLFCLMCSIQKPITLLINVNVNWLD